MTRIKLPISIKQKLIVDHLAYCKTILQSLVRVTICLVFILTAACAPGNTGNGTTINNYAGEKKDDPGGYGNGGTGDGGGGQGILCSKDTSDPSLRDKLMVRDLFEAVYNSKLQIKSLAQTSQIGPDEVSAEAIRLLIESLKSYLGIAIFDLEIGKEQFWIDFIKKISFIKEGAQLHPSQDANSPIVLPKGCKISQIAFWDDSSGTQDDGILYVNKEHWSKLDQINKIALLAHEYFFKEARQAGYKNSDFVRGKIGQLLSSSGLSPLFSKWVPSPSNQTSEFLPAYKNGFKICTGRSKGDFKSQILFYQYLDSEKNQNLVVPLIKSKGITISSLQAGRIAFTRLGTLLGATSDLLYYAGKELPDSSAQSKLLFSQLGILTNGSFEEKTPRQWLASSTEELILNGKKTVWADYFKGTSSPIKFSLANPVESIIPPEFENIEQNLTLLIQRIITAEFYRVAKNDYGITNMYEVDDIAYKAISILNKEIRDSNNDGTSPSKFPHWKNALSDAEKSLRKLSPENSPPLHTLDDGDIEYDLPDVLYKTLNKLYNSDDIEFIKKSYLTQVIRNRLPRTLPPARITIDDGIKEVAFEITCKSYDEAYLEFSISQKKVIQNDRPSTDIRYQIDSDDVEKVNPNLLAETIAVIKSRIWANQGAAEVCESATVRRENPKQCTHDIFLYDELRRNGTLNVKACPTYFESHFSDRPSDKDANTCFLFEIGKKYFLVLPSKGDQALQVQVIAPPDSHVPPG